MIEGVVEPRVVAFLRVDAGELFVRQLVPVAAVARRELFRRGVALHPFLVRS
jgi:hypothetical protein